MDIPENNDILISILNMKLRDGCPTLKEACFDCGWEYDDICARITSAGYVYNNVCNRCELAPVV